ncbi:MAG: Amuc_1102 family pilus-like protein [Roseibacillus sp.]
MRTITVFRKFLVVASLAFFTASLQAQEAKVDVDDVKYEDLESPEFGGNTGKKSWKPKNWLEAEVKLKAEVARKSDKKFLDRLVIKWYVAVKNPDGKGVSLLEKDITYINIPVDEDVYASVYLSPGAIMRITGGDRAGKSNIEAIAGEVTYNGAKVGEFNSMGTKKWWTAASVSRNDSIPLLAKSETPFKFLWWDRYLEEEPPRR